MDRLTTGCRVLFWSVLLSALLPNLIGFITPFVVFDPNGVTAESMRAARRVLQWNSVLHAVMLTPAPVGAVLLALAARRRWLRVASVVTTVAWVLVAWGTARWSVEAGPPTDASRFAAYVVEMAASCSLALLLLELAVNRRLAALRRWARVALALVVLNGSVGTLDWALPTEVAGVRVADAALAFARWLAVLAMFWTGRRLSSEQGQGTPSCEPSPESPPS